MRFPINFILILAVIAITFVPAFAYNGEVIFDQFNQGHQFQLVRGILDTDYDFYTDSQFVFSASVNDIDSTIRFDNKQLYTTVMLWRNITAKGMEQVNFDNSGDTAKILSIDDTAFVYKMANAIWKDHRILRAERIIFEQKDEIGASYIVSRSNDLYDYEAFVDEYYLFSAEIDPVDSLILLIESTELDPADNVLLMEWLNLGETGMTQVNYDYYGTYTDTVVMENTHMYYKMAQAMWADYRKKH